MPLLRALFDEKILWTLQVLVNAVLLALAWAWLSLPEASVWQLAGSGALAFLIVLAALWLHGTTLAAFRTAYGRPPFVGALKRLPALFVWALLAVALAALAWRYVPAKLVWLPAAAAAGVFVLLLPVASQVAGEGFPGFLRAGAWGPLTRWEYYAALLVAGLLGVLLPYKLIWWIPKTEGLRAQAGSMGVRFLAAYLLAVTAWFLMAAVVSRLSAKHGER